MARFDCAARNRLRTVGVKAWANRTKVAGYLGVTAGALYMALEAGQHWQLALLGAIVAAIGHYNDRVRDAVGP